MSLFTPADIAALEAAVALLEPQQPKHASPLDLACALDPNTVRTPALELINRELVRAFNGRNERLIISMPPQEGKSTLAGEWFPLWVLAQQPDTRIVLTSFSDRLARRSSRKIRSHVYTHGSALGVQVSKETWGQHDWRIRDHIGGIYATPVQGELTGQPADLIIIDDPHKGAKQADSDTQRDDVWEWWQSTASARLAPGAPVILILTRWHEDDLAGRLIADSDRWRVINIPARAEADDVLGRRPGEWLQSARGRTADEWQQIESQAGSRTFNALYQGRPSPLAGAVWQRTWWRRYDTPLWSDAGNGRAFRCPVLDQVILSWDMTFKDTKSSDFVVGQVWGRKGADVFLLDQVRKRMTFTETLSAFQALAKRWPDASMKLVEDKANGSAVIDSLKRVVPGIVAVNPKDSKLSRANAVAPFIEAGNVFLPSSSVALFNVDELIEESTAFPNGAHDDQVDAMSQALSRLLLSSGHGSAYLEYMRQAVGEVPVSTRNWRETSKRLKEGADGSRKPVRATPIRPV